MFKKLLCILVLMCLFLSGCSTVKPKNDYKTIKKRGYIVVGVRSDTRPFGFRDLDGRFQGFDIDLARAIAKHILADPNAVEFIPVTASDRISTLNSGKIDMLIATFSVTDLRRYVVDFSKPYYMAGQAILVRNDDEISSVKQLNGRRIIAVYGSTGEDSVKMNAPEAIIIGGGIASAFPLFETAMRQSLASFPYPENVAATRIEPSTLPNAAMLGASLLK